MQAGGNYVLILSGDQLFWMDGATIRQSLIAEGCLIHEGVTTENSVIGLRCVIHRNVVIRNSVLMGNDFQQTPAEVAADKAALGDWPGDRDRRSDHRQELPHWP